METFVIHKQSEAHFYAALRANNGRIILKGKDCTTLSDCKYSIDSIRSNATDYSKYELMTDNDGKYYFRVKSSGGDEIARSEIFEDTAERYAGIGLVRRTIPYAIIDDQSFAV
ncbi:MAG: DUF1508 domain-containing protein [Mariniphaga sp.]|nr:DUF1508 domain-containing protein [Mariniphaga sp.]